MARRYAGRNEGCFHRAVSPSSGVWGGQAGRDRREMGRWGGAEIMSAGPAPTVDWVGGQAGRDRRGDASRAQHDGGRGGCFAPRGGAQHDGGGDASRAQHDGGRGGMLRALSMTEGVGGCFARSA